MAASSSQNGIQLLLAAEQEAQHIVNAARTGDDSLPRSSYFNIFPLVCHIINARGTPFRRKYDDKKIQFLGNQNCGLCMLGLYVVFLYLMYPVFRDFFEWSWVD